MEYRIEKDSMGEMRVPADRYWAAQTQRSLENFEIGGEKMPREIIRAFAVLKKAAAQANNRLGKLDDRSRALIVLRYYKRMSLKDTAARLGVSYAYVKVLHKEALRLLRKHMGEPVI